MTVSEKLTLLVYLIVLGANLGVLALNLKLYTEWWKERIKR